MARPTTEPDWATAPTFSDGPIPGEPNKVAPSSGIIAEGFDPSAPAPAEWFNWLLNLHGQWISYHDGIAPFFGDGFDGDVTVSTTITLSRAMFYNNLILLSGGVIKTAGYPIFVRGIMLIDGTGKITANGSNAVDSNGAAGSPAGMMLGGANGGTGTTINGAAGGDITADSFGGNGGHGGTGSNGSPGFGGTATQLAASRGTPRILHAQPGFVTGLVAGTPTLTGLRGGAGGGAGSGNGGGTVGGGGGGGGGILYLMARAMVFTSGATSAAIQAAGGNGFQSSGSGGGGGGGGALIIGYSYKPPTTSFSGAINAPGGLHAAGGSPLAVDGFNGGIVELPLF